jgi:hypothetical protein
MVYPQGVARPVHRPGASLEEVTFIPEFDLAPAVFKLGAGPGQPIAISRPNSTASVSWTLDAQGRPITVEITEQTGVFCYQRQG